MLQVTGPSLSDDNMLIFQTFVLGMDRTFGPGQCDYGTRPVSAHRLPLGATRCLILVHVGTQK